MRRRSAPISAQWVLLPDDRRRRHWIRSRIHPIAFEVHPGPTASPYNPLFTSASQKYNGIEHLDYKKLFLYNPDSALQKCGHGSLVETQSGESYVAHICARPLLPELRCVLGRETALQKVEWTDDGWLKLAGGGHLAQREVSEPELPEVSFQKPPWYGMILTSRFSNPNGVRSASRWTDPGHH